MSIKGNRGLARFARIALAAGLVVGLGSGCSLFPKEEETLKPPLAKPVKETYDVAEATTGDIVRQVKGMGTYESTESRYEEFSVTGKVMEVNVKVGDKVKKGDVLIQLDVDGLELNLKEKERDFEIAKQALDQAKETRDAQTMKIRLLQYEIAETKLNNARKELEGKALLAEMDGVVTFVEELKPGDQVQLKKTYVKIDDPNKLRIAYNVTNPDDVKDVQVGMKVDIGYKDSNLTGKVVQTPSSAPQTDNKQLAEKYFRTLYIELDGKPPESTTIGTNVDIAIVTQVRKGVVKIPTRYLGSYLGRYFVKIQEGDSIKEVDVEKGLESVSPAEVEIVKGLKAGEKVILQQ